MRLFTFQTSPGLEPLSSAAKIARDVARRASDLGLETNVAVASNPDTAVLAALGFSGVVVIPQGREAEQLGNLPLEVLLTGGHDLQTLDVLERWGIRNLRALAALPEIALSERLGQEGIRLQQLARGCSSRSLVPVEPPLVFEEAIELEYPLVLLEPLAFLLGRLLDQLCARLGARALATQELNLDLTLECTPADYVGTGAPARPGRAQARQNFHRTLRLPVPLVPKAKLCSLNQGCATTRRSIVKVHCRRYARRARAVQSGLFLPPSPERESLNPPGYDCERCWRRSGSLQPGTHTVQKHSMKTFCPRQEQATRNPASRNDKRGTCKQKTKSRVTAMRTFRPLARRGNSAGRQAKSLAPDARTSSGKKNPPRVRRTSGDWWSRKDGPATKDIALEGSHRYRAYRLGQDLPGQWQVEGCYD
jgi:protein ImuB